MQTSYAGPIAIVGRGCVLPGAMTPEAFWQNCLDERSMIKPVSEVRLKRFVTNGKKKSKDQIQSFLACEVPREDYLKILEKHDLAQSEASRLYAYLHEAISQAQAPDHAKHAASRIDLIIGCMNPDTDYEKQIIRQNCQSYVDEINQALANGDSKRAAEIDKLVRERVLVVSGNIHQPENNFYSTEALARLAKHYAISGEHYMIDAACASSLVAMDMAVQRLRLGISDLVYTGGVESNLGYGAFMAFSVVGALAVENSVPFDKDTQGLVQGEGAVVFALKRASDAVRDQDKIYGLIQGVAGSSDGRSASLFQPNVRGQMVVYESLYGKDRRLSYLEAHGTGTTVGDQTEMESITTFFKGQNFPVGSCKTIVGHAKGAAGAVGVLKSLFIMNHKMVPASRKIKRPVFADPTGPHTNAENEVLATQPLARVGVNAFGFGGTNYHLLLEEYRAENGIGDVGTLPAKSPAVVITQAFVDMSKFEVENFLGHNFPFRLPPKILESTDKVQLAGLLAAWNCIQPLGKIWTLLPKEKVNVVSGCTLFLDKIVDWVNCFAFEIIDTGVEEKPERAALLSEMGQYIEKEILTRYVPLNEDYTPGILNNIIAGRVCNSFDLFGKSYNIDKDTASSALVVETVLQELAINPDQLFITLSVNEVPDPIAQKTIRKSIEARIITSASFALKHELVATGSLKLSMGGAR